jgi:hypothetical protein
MVRIARSTSSPVASMSASLSSRMIRLNEMKETRRARATGRTAEESEAPIRESSPSHA